MSLESSLDRLFELSLKAELIRMIYGSGYVLIVSLRCWGNRSTKPYEYTQSSYTNSIEVLLLSCSNLRNLLSFVTSLNLKKFLKYAIRIDDDVICRPVKRLLQTLNHRQKNVTPKTILMKIHRSIQMISKLRKYLSASYQ